MIKKIILFAFLIMSVSAMAQPGTGLLRPKYIGWPTDSSKWLTMRWSPIEYKTIWDDGSGESQSDSVFTLPPDTICVIQGGDTICVSQDSIYTSMDGDTICVIQGGDTTCVALGQYTDTHLGNTDLTNEGPRNFWLNNWYLRFIQANSLNGFQILPLSSQRMTAIQVDGNTANNRGVNQAALEIANTQATGTERNAYIRFLNGTNIYSLGEDLATPQGFTFSDSSNLKNPVWKYYSQGPTAGTPGDSLVLFKKTKFRSTLLDRDGDAGLSGQILSATGSGLNWLDPGSLSVPLSGLVAATQANTINNIGYGQEWQWNSLGGGSGLKLSSNSTGAASNLQKLLEVTLSGANSTSSQSTWAGYFSNTHTGTTSINYGIVGLASGASSSNYGIYGSMSGSSGAGVYGICTSGAASGVYGQSSLGYGLYGVSSGNSSGAAYILNSSSNTNGELNVLRLERATSGTAADGIAGGLDFYIEADNGTSYQACKIVPQWSTAASGTRTSRTTISGVSSTASNDIIYFEGDKRTRFNGRAETAQGADVASVAGAITLGGDGNVFEITGTNAITLISNLNWQNGSEITLLFTSTATLTDGTANSGTDIGMELAGNTNFTGSADDIVTLVLCEIGGTQRWRERSRSLN